MADDPNFASSGHPRENGARRDSRGSESGVRDRDAIRSWLTARVAERLKVAPVQVSATEPFTSYGLSSMVALSLSGELEEWLGFQLPPTLMWDYPTIEALSGHLAEESAAHAVSDSA